MSTDYAIAKQGSVEFIIDEASNRFALSIDDIKEDRAVTLTALTPDELVAVAARLLRVASYWGGVPNSWPLSKTPKRGASCKSVDSCLHSRAQACITRA